MKKIRRIRIRTKTSKVAIRQDQTTMSGDGSAICPVCGQPILIESRTERLLDHAESDPDDNAPSLPDRKRKEFLKKYEK